MRKPGANMDGEGNTAFVGLSELRYDDDWTRELPLAKRVPEPICGIASVDLKTGNWHLLIRSELREIGNLVEDGSI